MYSYVDVTPFAVRANLPADVVRILPWARVDSGATGAAPEGFSDWVVNALVAIGEAFEKIGQLVYGGLVALASFLVNLAEAIADWGMERPNDDPECHRPSNPEPKRRGLRDAFMSGKDHANAVMKDHRKAAEEFARHVKAKYGDRIERVVLYGSVARGDHRADSDVDLLIVTPADRLALQEDLSRDMIEFLVREGIVIAPLVVTSTESQGLLATGFGREVAREGFVVA